MFNYSRFRRIAVALASITALVCLVIWARLRGPTDRASEFANAINMRNFARAGDLLEPQDQSLPDKWANPKHWGDDGAIHADAHLAPIGISSVFGGVRHVMVTVHLDAESDHGTQIFPHTFAVTSNSLMRLPKKPDRVLYPVVIRPANSEPPWEIPPDLVDVPAMDLQIADDEKKRYFLIGNVESPSPRKVGRRVLVVMPGGDGSAAFSPFVRRIYQRTLNDEWVIAQIVAPKWARGQRVVWPLQSQSFPTARFSTEQLFDDVLADVAARCLIDRSEIYLLAWSSSGPPAYAIALRDKPGIAGAFIAMSVFNEREYSKPNAPPVAGFYLLQSPEDKVTPFRHAETARTFLASLGAKVELTQYAGGHGWHGKRFEIVSEGVNWLVTSAQSEQSHALEPATGSDSNGKSSPPAQ
jgi:predicted esterase